MKSLKLKKVSFYPTEIILLRKKESVLINIADIEYIRYKKPSFKNFLLSSIFIDTFPGFLDIYLKKQINKKKSYLVKIKYKEILELQSFFQKEIETSF